jgi:hypothetical protein
MRSAAAMVICRKPSAPSSRAAQAAGVERAKSAAGDEIREGGLGVGLVTGDEHCRPSRRARRAALGQDAGDGLPHVPDDGDVRHVLVLGRFRRRR